MKKAKGQTQTLEIVMASLYQMSHCPQMCEVSLKGSVEI